ncbi:hypothetical protein CC85DRAFT_128996 [Cutaneotrichosporon oleaginosum]|uniref:Uncharacterized protein n=1 Tax=Cutaneotrichosporon oleaginosum TaxID=879819 RepID=A0A0J0XJ22_9TREE|nr:uncharacterized protein CC85DRAFT_128996 [Cutaneotrichosporon oleaginosum]KLT41100.1 hypothetical protein CC85DRAFT_128996 [Cutaneotrichosporon oleaginosum]TXT05767.1 hypothetical protein COLE_07087 [Cutaneotrichosporon oleaginosum]
MPPAELPLAMYCGGLLGKRPAHRNVRVTGNSSPDPSHSLLSSPSFGLKRMAKNGTPSSSCCLTSTVCLCEMALAGRPLLVPCATHCILTPTPREARTITTARTCAVVRPRNAHVREHPLVRPPTMEDDDFVIDAVGKRTSVLGECRKRMVPFVWPGR